ncbi:Riboflavin transporter RibZ [subsurface metagenome]
MSNNTPKRTVLVVAGLSTFLVTFMGSSINIALPSISSELQIDAVLVSWIPTAYLLATATSLLPFGRLADIYGRKKILTCGIFVFTIATLLVLFTSTAGALIALRVVQGIGGAMIAATGVAIIISVFPARERGRALGISVAATYLGLSLGPILGGILTQHFGWRSIFLATIPLGVTTIPLVLYKMKGEWAEAKGEKFDLAGSVIYGLALVGIIYGFSLLPKTLGIVLIAAGTSGIFAFVRREMKVDSPLLDIKLFVKNRVFVFSNLTHLISYTATFSIAFLLSLYLQYIKGLSPQSAGLVLVAMAGVQSGFSPVAGRLSDRISPRILASIGLGLTAAGLSRFIFLTEDTSLAFIIGTLVLIGFGRALFVSPNTNAIMASVKQRVYGVASATFATMRQIGMTFSMGITMILLALYIGRIEITPQYYPQFLSSTKIAFIIFTALCSAGIVTSMLRGKTQRK